jgi:hypothetical protein
LGILFIAHSWGIAMAHTRACLLSWPIHGPWCVCCCMNRPSLKWSTSFVFCLEINNSTRWCVPSIANEFRLSRFEIAGGSHILYEIYPSTFTKTTTHTLKFTN